MNQELDLINKYERDIKFLAKRQQKCSSISFGDNKRDTGRSSNSLCSYAYGLMPVEELIMPNDRADYRACERMFNGLPKHRKTSRVKRALKKQEQSVIKKYGEQQ